MKCTLLIFPELSNSPDKPWKFEQQAASATLVRFKAVKMSSLLFTYFTKTSWFSDQQVTA